jgi:hypothetical protein
MINKGFTTHWEFIHEFAEDFGVDIQDTAQRLNISFPEAISLYNFLIKLDSADYEELHRIYKHEL